MKKQALIFDLDGTLVDSLRGITDSLNHALGLSGLPLHPETAVRSFVGDGVKMTVRRSAPTADEAVLDRLEHDFKSHYDVNWPAGTSPYHGISELLESLQAESHPLAVLSNKPDAFTGTIVRDLFPNIRFACVLGQRGGIPHKPDPVGALEIARGLGVEPIGCTVIGDSTMDLETARNAGMDFIGVSWGYHDLDRLVAAGCGCFADDPAGLRERISQRRRFSSST